MQSCCQLSCRRKHHDNVQASTSHPIQLCMAGISEAANPLPPSVWPAPCPPRCWVRTWLSPVNVRRRMTDMDLLNSTLCVPMSAENTE